MKMLAFLFASQYPPEGQQILHAEAIRAVQALSTTNFHSATVLTNWAFSFAGSILKFIFIALFVPVNLLALQDTTDFSAGILNKSEAIKVASSITTDDYPNADDVLVDDYIISRYEVDGTGVEWDDTYIKILSEKGRRNNQTLSIPFMLPYNQVAITTLELIKTDGSIVPIDIAAQSRIMVDPSQMDSNIYNPNSKILTVGIPGLEVGDTLHYVIKSTTMKALIPNTWSGRQLLEYTSPIKKFTYEVQAPASLPLQSIALKDPVEDTVKFVKEETDNRIIYRWIARDVPRMFDEPDMPSFSTVVQRILLSTIPNWEYISSWYWELSKPRLDATTPAMKAKVKELTEGLKSREEKIVAIFRWVAQKVRYLGITIETEAPGYEPHDVSLTFDARHGVCRDKAALLVAMLRIAGFKAYPVIIHTGPKKDEEVPTPFFNHAISAVENPDGSYMLMDATDESSKDIMPAYLSNKSFVVAKPEGETLLTSPVKPAEENMMEIHTKAELASSGSLAGESTFIFNGFNDTAYRGFLANQKADERRSFFEGVIKLTYPGAKLKSFELQPPNIVDMSKKLKVVLNFAVPDALIGDSSYAMLPLPRLGSRVGMFNFVLGKLSLKERKYPLLTNATAGIRETAELRLPENLSKTVSLPDYEPIDDDTISWTRELKVEDGVLYTKSESKLKVVEFSPEEYAELKNSQKRFEYNAKKMPIFLNTARSKDKISTDSIKAVSDKDNNPDARILEHTVEYQVLDSGSWTERHRIKKEILSYTGKKRYSEIKLGYNTAWKEARLLRASVKNGNKLNKISAEEQNVMDSEWVSSAPRYPASKTLVANLPGVNVDSIVEYEYELTRNNYPFISGSEIFGDHEPINKRQVILKIPKLCAEDEIEQACKDGKSLKDSFDILFDENGVFFPPEKSLALAKVKFTETQDKENYIYRWEANNIKAIKREPDQAPLQAFNPSLRFSNGSWDKFSKNVLKRLEVAAVDQQKSAKLAANLTDTLVAKSEKLIAIRDYIETNIRLAGPKFNELPLSELSPADKTLTEHYGNTTDRAILYYSMLKSAGFKPEFILAARTPRVRELIEFEAKLPSFKLFTDLLVRVKVGEQYIYFNDGDLYTALGASSFAGSIAMPLSEPRPAALTVSDNMKDQIEKTFSISLNKDGSALVEIVDTQSGYLYGMNKKRILELVPEKRRRYFEGLIAEFSQSAEATSSFKTDFKSYPSRISYSLEAKDFAVVDDNYLYLRLPNLLSSVLRLYADQKSTPFYQDRLMSMELLFDIELPKGFNNALILPDTKKFILPNDGGILNLTLDQGETGHQISVRYMLNLKPFMTEAHNYPEILDAFQELSHPESYTLLYSRNK